MRLLLWILLGIFLGPTGLGMTYPPWFGILAQIVGAAYLFDAGSELRWGRFIKEKTYFFKLFSLSFFFPFVVGFFYFDKSVLIALALSITALPVIVQVLKEKQLSSATLGQNALVVGSLCDLAAWIGIAFLLPAQNLSAWLIGHWPLMFFFLGFLNSAIASFRWPARWNQQVFAPLFFISMGWGIQESLSAAWSIVLPILLVGFLTKMVGGYWSARWAGHTHRQSLNFGLLVNIRGAMEIVAAHFAYQAQLIDIQVFSALVLLSLLSTLFAIPFLNKSSFD